MSAVPSPALTVAAAVRERRLSALEACEDALERAAQAGGAFWEVDADRARAAARNVDSRIAAGEDPGPLGGLPVAVKDSFAVAGLGRSVGLDAVTVCERDAKMVAALRDAGAVLIGTTAMDQLAWTMSGRCPGRPPYDNPVAPGRSPGGSSGGAAVAVAGGAVSLALGCDSAGSVRVPATWCGVVGFKPSFGVLSVDGCAPLARRFDTVGIIAGGVADAAAAFAALTRSATPPGDDRVSATRGAQTAAEEAPTACPPRIGTPATLVEKAGCDADVAASWQRARAAIVSSGMPIRDVEATFSAPGMGTIFAAELAARWGEAVRAQPQALVHPEVRDGVRHGSTIAAAVYVQAGDALDEAARGAAAVFDEVDLLALPCAPIAPPPVDRPAPVAVASALTRPWSAYGWPAVAIPLRDSPGTGVQLVAALGQDERLLHWAAHVERAIAGEDAHG